MKGLIATIAAVLGTGAVVCGGAVPNDAAHKAVPTAQGELPKGHPDIATIEGKGIENARLNVRVVQGTPGGTAVAGSTVTVEFYSSGAVARVERGTVDGDGKLSIQNLVLPKAGAMPLVRVTHGRAEFQTFAPVITAKTTESEVIVPVFESTEERPAWRFATRHVMLQATPEGLHVLEMFAVENPSDRAWLGQLGADGARQTFALELPEGFAGLDVYTGYIRDKVRVDGRRIISLNAMPPGVTKYQIAYTVPVTDGKATVTLVAPAVTERLSVFAPADGSKVTTEGIEPVMRGDPTKSPFRGFQANAVPANAVVKLTFDGIKPQGNGSAAPGLPAGHPQLGSSR